MFSFKLRSFPREILTGRSSMMSTSSKRIKTVLIDLSGTLHIENEATPKAIEALERLRATEVNIKFVTNTTKESQRILYERLRKLGFNIKNDEIFTCLSAARDLIKNKSYKPLLLISDDALEDFEGLTDFDGEPNAVVIGLAPEKFDKKHMNQAFNCLLNGADLIAVHVAKYFKQKDGLSLGPGPFVKILEHATGKKPTVVGKPNAAFFLAALSGEDPSTAVMIGDDVTDDIDGAQKAGARGYLVRTGKYRAGDEIKISPPPYKTCDNFCSVVDDLVAELSSCG